MITIACLGLLALGAFGVLVKWRGFRASSRPSAFEATVARSLRDFAIPGAEIRKVNPFAGDAVAQQQGRDAFLARCASCHGADGRGATPIGANEYPRVPVIPARVESPSAQKWRMLRSGELKAGK